MAPSSRVELLQPHMIGSPALAESDSAHNSTSAVCDSDDVHAHAGKLNCLVADSEGCDQFCTSLGLDLDRDRRTRVIISSTDASLA